MTLFMLIHMTSCGYIIQKNKEYEEALPRRIILMQVDKEEAGVNPHATKNWHEHWQSRIKQLRRIGDDELIELIIKERRKRGLPELKGNDR